MYMKIDKKKSKGFINKKSLISYPLIFISVCVGLLSHFFLSPYSQNIEKDLCCSLYENKIDDVILVSAKTEADMPEDFYEKYCLKDNRGVFETAKFSKNVNFNNQSFPLISTNNNGSIYFTYNHMSSLTSRGFNGFKNFKDENAVYLTEQLAKNIFSISATYVDSSILNKEIEIQNGDNLITLVVKGIISTDKESSAVSSGYLFKKEFGEFGVVSNETIEKFQQAGILESFYTKSFPKVSTFASTYDKFSNILKSKKLTPSYTNDFINDTLKDLKNKKNSSNYIVPGILLTLVSLTSLIFAVKLIYDSKPVKWYNAVLVLIFALVPYVTFLGIKIKINEYYTCSIYSNGSVLFGSLITVIYVFIALSKFIFIAKKKEDENELIELAI